VITARLSRGAEVAVLAPVRGLATEATQVVRELEAFRPEAVGLGLSAEELRGLVGYFVLSDAEPVVPLTSNELAEVRGLVRFGEVLVPNPSSVAALGWGRDRGVPVAPLDPDEEDAAALFADKIGYFELVRRTVREHRVGRAPPAPSSADEYALAWDGEVAKGRGSRAYARARDEHLVAEVDRLAAGRSRVTVVVDRERFDGVRTLLASPAR
jgi:hypothetical protein